MNPTALRPPALLVAALLVATSAVSAQDPAGEAFVIRNVRVFDGEKVLTDHDVAVAGGVITGVGRDLPAPEGAREIDGTDRTLLPGLIDAHTHTIQPGMLEEALDLGVTTELDMFMSWQVARSVREAQAEGQSAHRADLFSAGTLVTAPGGHGTEYGVPIPTITRPDEAQAFVDARLEEGSDYIKIVYDTGETFGAAFPTLDKETLAAVIDATHAREKLAVVHIGDLQGARDAIELGADGLVHIFFEPADVAAIDELVALAVRHETFVTPTLTVLESVSGAANGASLTEDVALGPYLSPAAVANLKQSFPGGDTAQAMAAARTAVQRLAAAGVPILTGSDAPNPGTAHGASIHRELELLVEAGLKPVDALRAATSAPAASFGLADRGAIRPGLRADLLLVAGDPTEAIKATRDIIAIWKRGIPVEREVRSAELAARSDAGEASVDSAGGLVSDFESGDMSTEFGAGWTISTDAMFGGGASHAATEVVEDGASGSSRSMHITGEIVAADTDQLWAGAIFYPGQAQMSPVDLSAHEAISFWARGDGSTYYVMLFLQSQGFNPAIQPFTTGDDWEQHTLPLESFAGTDGSDIMGLYFGGGGMAGELDLWIDEVRFVDAEVETAEAAAPAGATDNLVHPAGYESVALGSLGAVEVVGSGPRDLVLIPGFGLGGEVFDAFAELNAERYRMLVVTPAGFGETAAPPMPEGSESYGERIWCRAFEEALWKEIEEHGLERPVLVGFSDGFQSALRLALAHPEEVGGLVSVVGEAYRNFPQPLTPEERVQMIDTRMAQNWFKTVSEDTWRTGMGTPEWYSASAEIGENLYAASLVPTIPTMVRYYCEKWSDDPRTEVLDLSIPILALLPDSSELTDDAMYQGFLASALHGPWESFTTGGTVETVTVDGARMGMLVDRTEEVSARLATFVEGLGTR